MPMEKGAVKLECTATPPPRAASSGWASTTPSAVWLWIQQQGWKPRPTHSGVCSPGPRWKARRLAVMFSICPSSVWLDAHTQSSGPLALASLSGLPTPGLPTLHPESPSSSAQQNLPALCFFRSGTSYQSRKKSPLESVVPTLKSQQGHFLNSETSDKSFNLTERWFPPLPPGDQVFITDPARQALGDMMYEKHHRTGCSGSRL